MSQVYRAIGEIAATLYKGEGGAVVLVSSAQFYDALEDHSNLSFFDSNGLPERFNQLLARLREGENLLFVGCEGLALLKELWIDSVAGIESAQCRCSELLPDFQIKRTKARKLFILPPDRYTQHGIHPEPRAEIVPLIASQGRYGGQQGVSAMLVKNYDTMLTAGGFQGSFLYIFAFERPLEAIAPADWNRIAAYIKEQDCLKCYIKKLLPEYPLYYTGEEISIGVDVQNLSDELLHLRLSYELYTAEDRFIKRLGEEQLCLNGRECQHVTKLFYEKLCGVYRIRAVLSLYDRRRLGPARRDIGRELDTAVCGIYVKDGAIVFPQIVTDTNGLVIDGREDFIIGTHYYPTNSFTDLSYRPFRIDKAYEELKSMKENGVRLVRIWLDRVMDETAFRAIESCLDMIGMHGMCAILTLYTSWYEYSHIDMPDCRLGIRTERLEDDTLIGFTMEDMEAQKAYVGYIVRRFAGYQNLIWNLTNEFSVCYPEKTPYESIAVFKEWADTISEAVRTAGGRQPIIRGVSCWDTGSENYLSTKDGDILAYHLYLEKEPSLKALMLENSSCIRKPFIVEEFGGTWRYDETADNYDYRYHAFLASGAALACNYEWGISWLADRLPPTYPDLKYHSDRQLGDLDDRFIYKGRFLYAQSWENEAMGICPWAASFEYGINYPCTTSMSPVKRLIARFGEIGKGLAYRPSDSGVVLVIPMEFTAFRKNEGYGRKTALLYETLDWLWENGVVFSVCQEDSIDTLAGKARLILFPNERPINADTAERLKACEQSGATVYYGSDRGFLNKKDLHKIYFKAAPGTKLLIRQTRDGAALIFLSEQKQRVALEDGVELGAGAFALAVYEAGRLVASESVGTLIVNALPIVKTDRRYYLKALDHKALPVSRELLLLPFESGRYQLDERFNSCEISDYSGNIKAILDISGGELGIADDALDYRYVLRARPD